MKNPIRVAVGTALLALLASAPPSLGQDLRIGFVNTLEVLYGTEEGKAEIASIQAFVEEKQKEYDSRKVELDQLTQQFQNQQRTLNPQTRGEMQRKIDTDQRELQRFQEDTQLEINRRRDELLSRVSQKIQAVIDEFAAANQYMVIFQRNETQVWVDPALEVTQEILRLYNEKHGAAGASPSAQP